MRLAVLADVHGNLRALEAVLKHIRGHSPDALINLGDCVSGPLWPGETCDLLRSVPTMTVRGNHDRAVAQGCEMGASDGFAHEQTTPQQREWLGALPFELLLDGVWCFHANPRDDIEFLIDEVADGRLRLPSDESIQTRLGPSKAPVVLCGHSHVPRIVRLGSGTTIINPGTVGFPAFHDAGPPGPYVLETGSPHARYALVTIGQQGVQAEFVALEYDWEEASATALRNGRADWAHALRTGYVTPP